MVWIWCIASRRSQRRSGWDLLKTKDEKAVWIKPLFRIWLGKGSQVRLTKESLSDLSLSFS
jgi:hypothetical protein